MASLIVALPAPHDEGSAYRFVLSPQGMQGMQGVDGTGVETGFMPLESLPRAAHLTLVVPSRRLSWQQVVLPRVSRSRLRSALDGLLEERLLDDLQNLHFALAPDSAPGMPIWVAVCDHAWLAAEVADFESAGQRVERIVPEHEPLAAGLPATWYVAGSVDDPWLVRCADDGVQTLPYTPAWGALAKDTDGTDAQLAAQPDTVDPAQRLVQAAQSRWNLAQFELTSSARTRMARAATSVWFAYSGSAAWRPARWGLLAVLLSQLAGLQAWAWQERRAQQTTQGEIRNLLTRTFPKVTTVIDAPVQMTREVAALRQATGTLSGQDLEAMLAVVASNLPVARVPSALQYSPGVLTLQGLTLAPPEAEALAVALTSAGYSRQMESQGEGKVESLVVRSSAAGTAALSRRAPP